jgi:dTDP-4-amino-4,6-dideoxygalactose transaminase
MERLAIDGGKPIFEKPLSPRKLFDEQEKLAVMRMFDEAIKTGEAFGYNGPAEKQYEKDFADFMQGGFADGVNSGTNAVFCAIGALQLDAFSEVIVPPITDNGGVTPVVFAGCVPVMADSDPRTFNVCADGIKPLINERTRAILVAHIGGEPVDMDPIVALAREHNLYLIEDCAQSHAAKYKGKMVGTFGDIAAFSTMFGKHHCTGGQGGVVYTRNEKLHWQGRRFADRGKPFNLSAPNNVVAGLNCNLNDLSACIGSVQIKKLPGIIEKRRKLAAILKQGLKKSKAVSMGWQVPDTESSYWFVRLKFDSNAVRVDKQTFCKALEAEGVMVNSDYNHVPCTFQWFKDKAVFGKSGFPWNCSDYKGPRNPSFKMDNTRQAVEAHFIVHLFESWNESDINNILAALSKVEAAYLR